MLTKLLLSNIQEIVLPWLKVRVLKLCRQCKAESDEPLAPASRIEKEADRLPYDTFNEYLELRKFLSPSPP